MNTEQITTRALEAVDSTDRQPANLPTVRNQQGEAVPALFGGQFELSATNFDGPPEALFEFVMLAKNADAIRLADCANQIIEVEWFYAHAVELEQDDGEIESAIRTVLVAPDGQMYAAVSKGVFDFLRSAVMAFGLRPFKPALKVQVISRETAKKRRTILLVPAPKQKRK